MKLIAAGLVLLLVLACYGYKEQQTPQQITCGVVSGGSTVVAKGVDWAEGFGKWVHELASEPIGPETVKVVVEGIEKVVWFWLRTAFLSARGIELDPEILRLKEAAEAARVAAEAQCTPCPQALPQDSSPLASLGAAPVSGSPEEVVRQVAARYWPADQVDIAVAIAGAESTFRPTASLTYRGAHMRGLWQINDRAHANLIAGKQWQDPSVNAYMAHQIWEDAGRSWKPWSTYNSGSYRKFLKPSAVAASIENPRDTPTIVEDPKSLPGTFTPDAEANTTAPPAPVNPQNAGCSSSGMPAARISTWNSNFSRPTDARVVRGMLAIAKQSDIVNTQELSNGVRRQRVMEAMKAEGFDVVGQQTAHPIFFRTSAFTLTSHTEQKVYERGDDIEGLDQGTRYVNTVVLRSVAEGKTLTDINYHQLPHIQRNGNWIKGQPKRRAMAEQITATAMTSVRTHVSQGAVVVVGDMNWSGDPGGAYRAAGLTMAAQVFGVQATLRKREIDHIMWTAGTPVAQRELGRYGSDHVARVVDFPASAAAPTDAAGQPSAPTPAEFNFPGQRTVDQAIAYMQAQGSSSAWSGRCLAVVGRAYGQSSTQPFNGHFYAIGQFENMPTRYKHTDGSVPPRGALVFWRTGSPAGHIAISDGNGYVWTSDPPGGRRGSVARVKIERVDAWGPRAGWSSPFFPGRTKTGAAA